MRRKLARIFFNDADDLKFGMPLAMAVIGGAIIFVPHRIIAIPASIALLLGVLGLIAAVSERF
jgi:hypothetical protein